MWTQKIEYEEEVVEVVSWTTVKKQMWDADTNGFVLVTLYRKKGLMSSAAEDWMIKTFGPRGIYKKNKFWNFSRAGNLIIMDEKVYMWYQMKWNNQ